MESNHELYDQRCSIGPHETWHVGDIELIAGVDVQPEPLRHVDCAGTPLQLRGFVQWTHGKRDELVAAVGGRLEVRRHDGAGETVRWWTGELRAALTETGGITLVAEAT